MKWLRVFLVFGCLLAPLVSQNLIRGEIRSTLYGQYAADGSFDSLLNPQNIFGLKEYNLINQANLRMEQSGDRAALDFRLDFTAYPVADMLAGTAAILATDPLQAAMAADLVYSGLKYIWSADLTRAAVVWFPRPEIQLGLGRQGFQSGYGYGWSPLDLVNPPKDPADPRAFVQGVDSITLNLAPFYWISLLTWGLLPDGAAAAEELIAGGELTLFLPLGELKLAGQYGGTEKGAADAYTHSAAMGLYLDILGAGVYAEGAFYSRSRRPEWDSSSMSPEEISGPVLSFLGGAEYIFPSGNSLILEYFMNGEGWNKPRRKEYSDSLAPGPSSAQMVLFTPSYFAQHYLMLHWLIPFYDWNGEISLSGIFSPDSGSLLIAPLASFNLDSAGNLSCEISYNGAWSLYEDAYDEVSLLPADQGVSLMLSYAF